MASTDNVPASFSFPGIGPHIPTHLGQRRSRRLGERRPPASQVLNPRSQQAAMSAESSNKLNVLMCPWSHPRPCDPPIDPQLLYRRYSESRSLQILRLSPSLTLSRCVPGRVHDGVDRLRRIQVGQKGGISPPLSNSHTFSHPVRSACVG